MRFLPWLGRLRKIELLTIRRGQGGSGFSDRTEKQNFWIQLAESCPELEAIHFSEELDLAFSIPMDLFPGVQEWGLDCETKNPGLMFKILADNKLEDRLTTLELLTADSQIGSQYASFSYTQRDKLLRRVLCSAPQLLHLKTGLLRISSHVFWDEQNPEWTIWACRGLRTLSMRLDGHMKYSATSRHVFGYLSRVCPRLEDLSIVLRCPTFALESGLCLLTRLQYLQRLEVISDYAGPHYGDRFPVRDFGWITEITNPPTPPKPKVVASVISSLVSSMTFKKRDTFDDRDQTDHISEDFQYCIDKNRASLRKTVGADNAAGKWKFSKIQWQQHDNHYRSDYDRIPFKPMVDGLEGLEYCGSLLDIDARLNSMLFALLTEQQKRKTQITDTIRVQLRATQPWPLLETLVLSFGSCCKGSGIELPSKLIEGQKILRKLRPDIAIFCRSESER
ncbi:hypothetical protein BGZ83_006126 [Gryganskiella cystojenkinii]|nr:hypothetical protein BGZ83_006126 [Gryganskiella cystojenkinii]